MDEYASSAFIVRFMVFDTESFQFLEYFCIRWRPFFFTLLFLLLLLLTYLLFLAHLMNSGQSAVSVSIVQGRECVSRKKNTSGESRKSALVYIYTVINSSFLSFFYSFLSLFELSMAMMFL